MESFQFDRWSRRILHECGHAVAAMAKGHCPAAIFIGKMIDEHGQAHHGLTKECALPETAPDEDKAIVILAGMAAERIFGLIDQGGERDLKQVMPIIEKIRTGSEEPMPHDEIINVLQVKTVNLLEQYRSWLDEMHQSGIHRAKTYGFTELNFNHMELFNSNDLRELFKDLRAKMGNVETE